MSVLAAVVPEDASYTAVLKVAGTLARGEPLTVLSLHPAPPVGHETVALRSPSQRTLEAREEVQQRIQKDLDALGITATVSVPVARRRNVGDEIAARAEKSGVRLIVTGTQSRTGLSRLVLGSVAEHLVRHAHCDVYVARGQPSD